MTEFRLSIPYVLPSINIQQRMHWAGRARIKQRCMEYLMEARSKARKEGKEWAGPAGKPWPKAVGRFRLTIERWAPRALDRDNLVATYKSLIDAMKVKGGMGLIADDSPAHMVHLEVVQYQTVKAMTRTEIVLITED